MNLGVVTLNIPRIALEANGDRDKFWTLLDQRLQIVKDALVYRVERCKEASPANAPILYMYGAFGKRLDRKDNVNELFKNKRATVSLGYIGLYEAAAAFYGGEWENDPEAKAFTLAIVKELKAHADAWGDEYGYHFSVYSTPSESLTDRFCRLDTEKFGIVEDITDKEYYTNSFHYDVRKNPTPFEKLDFEKDYPVYCSGGFIHYCEYPVLQQNPKALEAVWNYAYDRVAYLGTNTPIDHCYECGYEGDFNPTERGFECPQCGNHDPKSCDVVKRTCGYLGNPQARPMVNGRHKEISARVKHMKNN
jgi:anaerobic ribonucleoside-triphosphate reductase